MRKKMLILSTSFATVLFSSSIIAQNKNITFDDIFTNQTFVTKSIPGFNSMKDDNYYTAIRVDKKALRPELSVSKYQVEGRKHVGDVVNVTALMKNIRPDAGFEDYTFNEDESMMLLKFDGESIYRHSTKYLTYLYDRKNEQMTLVDEAPILHATFSPDGKKIAFVKSNNLYIYDIASAVSHQITHDGKWNHIINGNCDWVYEEEFSFTQAYQWSPDSRHIAFYKFDESHVKEYTMAYYNDLYPTQYTFKYPKAGEDNSIVNIHMYNVATHITYPINIDNNTDIYIPRIKWANANELFILKLNRLQNHLEYISHDVKTKKNHIELSESNKYYVDILDPIVFYNNGENMLYLSEKEGYVHLFDFNRKTKKDTNLTPYDFDVSKILGYNTSKQNVYFIASPDNAMNNGIYAVSLKNKKISTIAEQPGWYSVQAFPSVSKFVVTHSHAMKPPVISLMDASGKTIQVLEDNEKVLNTIKDYNFGTVEFMQLTANDGETQLNGYLMLPHDFDKNKKYPVLLYQYSGPGSQEVKNTYSLGHRLWHQYLTTQGYIIACFDGRGTGNRGEEFKKMTYLQLGKYESEDQIAIAKQLGDMPFIDKSRIGIWGWSYGGFISSTCILKGNDVFKTAISVAPVTHWALYDNIYTERFMRKPQDNPSGYNNNSPIAMAKQLEGNLLLIHGTADDNVHFQNAVMLTDALIQHNKQFESIYYPNGNHGIGGGVVRAQLYKKMTNYILEKL